MKNIRHIFHPDTKVFDDKDQGNRYYLLDLLRFIACVMVIFWHYQHFFYISPGTSVAGFSLEQQPFFDLFARFYRMGFWGVQIFWALSGFVFFALFARKIGEQKLSVKQFAWDRFSRLYPLHLVSLILVALLTMLLTRTFGNSVIYPCNDWYHFVLNLFFVPYIFPNGGWSFNSPVWSVSLELLAYVVFYLYARFLKAGLLKTICMVLIFEFLKPYPASFPFAGSVNSCLFFFFSGGSLFLLIRKCSGYVHYAFVYLFLDTVFFLIAYRLKHIHAWILFSVFLFSIPVPLPKKIGSLFFMLGNQTYSIYMLHISIQLSLFFVVNVILKRKMYEIAKSPWFFVGYWLILMTTAFLMYHYFELPVKNKLRRIMKPEDRQ